MTDSYEELIDADELDRTLDLAEVEDIDTLGIQIDLLIKHLRALRDRVAFEAERRRGEPVDD